MPTETSNIENVKNVDCENTTESEIITEDIMDDSANELLILCSQAVEENVPFSNFTAVRSKSFDMPPKHQLTFENNETTAKKMKPTLMSSNRSKTDEDFRCVRSKSSKESIRAQGLSFHLNIEKSNQQCDKNQINLSDLKNQDSLSNMKNQGNLSSISALKETISNNSINFNSCDNNVRCDNSHEQFTIKHINESSFNQTQTSKLELRTTSTKNYHNLCTTMDGSAGSFKEIPCSESESKTTNISETSRISDSSGKNKMFILFSICGGYNHLR